MRIDHPLENIPVPMLFTLAALMTLIAVVTSAA